MNLDCLENLSILVVQEDHLVLTLRVVLLAHWVLAGQSIQLHLHIKYNQYKANVYQKSKGNTVLLSTYSSVYIIYRVTYNHKNNKLDQLQKCPYITFRLRLKYIPS